MRTKTPSWLTRYVGTAVLTALFSNLGPLVTMRWPLRLWAELCEGDRVGRDLADVLDRLGP